MKRVSSMIWLTLLLVSAFAMATILQPIAVDWNPRASSGALNMLLGESRRNVAFFVYREADIAFHSGYYPTIFDQGEVPKTTGMTTEQHGHDEEEHEKEMAFLGKPRDWIDAFGRNFKVTEHTHLESGREREILPYLKVSAELNPNRIETYTVASFWLRTKLGKVKEAEDFLRDGLRNNPDSYEILLELGNLYHESRRDDTRAGNVWRLALKHWITQNAKRERKDQDLFELEQIAFRLADLEEKAGNLEEAINLLNLTKRASPNPQVIEKQIEEIRKRIPPKS